MSDQKPLQPLEMPQLLDLLESIHRSSPQRLLLARAYLQSLMWGIAGLKGLGQDLGFVLMPPAPPMEFPKMLFRGTDSIVVNSTAEEARANGEGWMMRQETRPATVTTPPPSPPLNPPVISIPRPGAPT